jgi:hypothetical protein
MAARPGGRPLTAQKGAVGLARAMKALLAHVIFISTVLFGGDGTFNDGQDTQRLMRDVEHWAMGHQAQVHAAYITDDMARYVSVALPAQR